MLEDFNRYLQYNMASTNNLKIEVSKPQVYLSCPPKIAATFIFMFLFCLYSYFSPDNSTEYMYVKILFLSETFAQYIQC
jgi:hypothetical protein